MRKLILQTLFLASVAVAAGAQSGRKLKNPPPPPPPPLPVEESLRTEPNTVPLGPPGTLPESVLNHKLQAIDDSTFRLADFSGKVIVVNVWATWCGPCRREVPDYEKVRKEFAGRDVEFVALTTEDPIAARAKVQKFARELHFGFRIAWADRDTARALMDSRGGIPQTVVIGTNSHVTSRWVGYSAEHSSDRLRAAINRALDSQDASNTSK